MKGDSGQRLEQKSHELPAKIKEILMAAGVNPDLKMPIPGTSQDGGWARYSFQKDGDPPTEPPVPVYLFEHNMKTFQDARSIASRATSCIAIFRAKSKYAIFLKYAETSYLFPLKIDYEYEQIRNALISKECARATTQIQMMMRIKQIIEAIPTTTPLFENRGVFSTHYLKNRMFDDIRRDWSKYDLKSDVWYSGDAVQILKKLGWRNITKSDTVHRADGASIVLVGGGVPLFKRQRWHHTKPPRYC